VPTKDSTVISARVANEVLKVIRSRLGKEKPTINFWLTWAVKQGIRNHKKKGEG